MTNDAGYWSEYAEYLTRLGPQKPTTENTLFSPNRASQEFGLVYMHAWRAVRTRQWRQYYSLIGRGEDDAPTAYMVPAAVGVEGGILGVGFDTAPTGAARLRLKGRSVHQSIFYFAAATKGDLKKIPHSRHSIEAAGLKIAVAHDDAAIRRLDEELIFAQVSEKEVPIQF